MTRPAAPGILRGVLRLARFQADGFPHFAATPAAFLNSLPPLLAFPLVVGVLLLVGGAPGAAAEDFLGSLVALLAPAVLSQALALLWRREARWLRYAVAYNWCQAGITLLAVLLVSAMLSAGDRGTMAVLAMAVMALLIYWLVLGWFLAARGLGLSWWRAVIFVVLLNLGTTVLVFAPRLVGVGAT